MGVLALQSYNKCPVMGSLALQAELSPVKGSSALKNHEMLEVNILLLLVMGGLALQTKITMKFTMCDLALLTMITSRSQAMGRAEKDTVHPTLLRPPSQEAYKVRYLIGLAEKIERLIEKSLVLT